jgi:hypothetical protein
VGGRVSRALNDRAGLVEQNGFNLGATDVHAGGEYGH